MNKVIRVVFSSVTSLIFVAAIWAIPATSAHPNPTLSQAAPQTQSVSGKIASVEKNSFTLTVASDHLAKLGQTSQEAVPKSMTFAIDKNTTVDGKLQVGATADVTYREENGKNIAISVRVTP